MDNLLFTGRSIWTMVHGIVLGGGALMALAAALFSLAAMRTAAVPDEASERQATYLAGLLAFSAAALWLTVLVGTYISFPAYRATPPEGTTDLGQYPRALIHSKPGNVWLHALGMEIKEHMPWIAAMLATAAAFITRRYRSLVLGDTRLRRMTTITVAICFVLSAAVGLLGILINKVAPLE